MVNRVQYRFTIVAAVIAATFFLCHCGKKQYQYIDRFDGVQSDEVRAVIHILGSKNNQVRGVKGIGSVRWQHKDTQQKFRAAWIADMPNRFRLELLGVTGQPLASLASNGIWNFLLYHSEDRLIKKRTSKDDLKRFLSIRLSIEDLVHFLCGRLPIETGGAGWLEQEPAGDIQKLIYKETASQVFYHIFYDEPKKMIQKIERMDEKGELILRVSFHSTVTKNGLTLPSAITITNGLDATFEMKIDNLWVNPSATADKFELIDKN